MPTSIKENYLKALHFLSLQSGVVSLTELGNAMEVSKPTVNDMVKKLAAKGWVKHERYQPSLNRPPESGCGDGQGGQ